jgi:phosphoribosylaminoimidazolecarboxamide formyltransferase/IMP cyclohydrolase
MLEGRVKTLHPRVHGGILAKTNLPQHQEDLKKHNISPIQLVSSSIMISLFSELINFKNKVAVNLYPFVETIKKADTTLDIALENVDIGGHTLIRFDLLFICRFKILYIFLLIVNVNLHSGLLQRISHMLLW